MMVEPISAAGSATSAGLFGLRAAQLRLDGAARRIATGTEGPEPADVVELVSAGVAYRASAAVVRAGSRTMGTVLDLIA